MGIVYQGQCESCQFATHLFVGQYDAAYQDEPLERVHAHHADPHLIVLAHPLESTILEALNTSYEEVAQEGRLIEVHDVLCLRCGHLHENRKLGGAYHLIGCWGMAILYAGGFVLGWVVANSLNFLDARIGGPARGILAATCLLACFTGLPALFRTMVNTVLRRRYAERAMAVATPPGCPECGRRFTVGAESLLLQFFRLPCAACKRHALRVFMVGIS